MSVFNERPLSAQLVGKTRQAQWHQPRTSVLGTAWMYQPVGAAEQVQPDGWLKQQTFISHSSRSQEVQDLVPAGSGSGEAPLPRWWTATFSLCLH